MIAPTTLHVNQENVSIHVQLLMSVLQMLIAELLGTRQSALVLMDILVHLNYLAHCVSASNLRFIQFIPLFKDYKPSCIFSLLIDMV